MRITLPLFICVSLMKVSAQKGLSVELIRYNTGVSGSSQVIAIKNNNYIVQQSIGQASVIGTFITDDLILRQGFLQPNVSAKFEDKKTIVNNSNAIIYPNPFTENVSLSFSDEITSPILVEVYDLLGRLLFTKEYTPSQSIDIMLGHLPVATYVLKANTKNTQIIKKIIKK